MSAATQQGRLEPMAWRPLRPEDIYSEDHLRWLRAEGHWRDTLIWDLVEAWSTEDPSALAVVDDDRSVTIRELRDAAARVAGGLHEHGVVGGDRVVVQMTNRIEAAIAFCASARLGAILVPVQPALRRHDVEALLRRTQARLLISIDRHRGFDHANMARELRERVPSLEHVFIVGSDSDDLPSFDQLLDARRYEGPLPRADDPALMIFTSGTTAEPKGCLHTSNTFMFTGRGTGGAMGLGPSDVVFMPSPVMHTTGLVVGLLSPLVYRIPSILQAVWEPTAALEMISRHGCTVTLGATAFGTMFLKSYDPDRHDLSSFRLFGLAGSPVPSETVARIQERLGCRVLTMYGSTEGLCLTATRPDDGIDRVSASDGRAIDGVRMWITDPEGNELPAGEEGEIRLIAPGRFLCYWDDDERTFASVDAAGRFRTGDLARMDSDGYVRITGRLADIIIRGGMNISAAEVEGYLLEHPDVEDVAIVGMPDDRLGEKACAFVVARRGAPNVAELASLLERKGVAKYKYPERVEIVKALPRNPTGKVEKFKLRSDIRSRLGE